MKDLNYQLMKLCRENRDGSFSTQATRRRILDRIANQLHELGYRRMQAKSLKPKHVEALVARWKDQGLGVGTLKNLMGLNSPVSNRTFHMENWTTDIGAARDRVGKEEVSRIGFACNGEGRCA